MKDNPPYMYYLVGKDKICRNSVYKYILVLHVCEYSYTESTSQVIKKRFICFGDKS
jgi:hypothetical protein